MNREIECERTLLVQADFDGELDAATAAALIAHERECAECRRARGQLVRSRALLRAAPRYAAPAAVRAAIARRLPKNETAAEGSAPNEAHRRELADAEDLAEAAGRASGADARRGGDSSRAPRAARPARSARLAWVSALAAAAALVAALLLPRSPDVGPQLVANHLRAMQLDSHLIDVVSSDHHTVKPWFAGKVAFAPVVKEIDGYILKGGRVDIVNGAAAAVLVYQAGRHVIDVYMWPASAGIGTLRPTTQIEGFNLQHWQESGLTLWCISDTSADELDRFAQRWRQ